jgi:hypothetical protein
MIEVMVTARSRGRAWRTGERLAVRQGAMESANLKTLHPKMKSFQQQPVCDLLSACLDLKADSSLEPSFRAAPG